MEVETEVKEKKRRKKWRRIRIILIKSNNPPLASREIGNL